jgi:hypothetical protein
MAIDVHALIDDAKAIARQPNDAFHIMRMIVVGKLEDDNVASANGTVREKFLVPGAAPFEHEFIHEKMVAYEQCGFHRLRWNLEGLHDKSGAEKGEKDRDEQRFGIFDHRAARNFARPNSKLRLRRGFKRRCFDGHHLP